LMLARTTDCHKGAIGLFSRNYGTTEMTDSQTFEDGPSAYLYRAKVGPRAAFIGFRTIGVQKPLCLG
jgi:hypothetical protein